MKKVSSDLAKVRRFPEGTQFVQVTLSLMSSDAWRDLSINERRLLDFLMIENMNHAGQENGKLMATYDQLVKHGIARRLIHKTISGLEEKRLILVERGGRRGFVNHLNKFTLTFLPKTNFETKPVYFTAPTDDWKNYKSTLRSDTISVNQNELKSQS